MVLVFVVKESYVGISIAFERLLEKKQSGIYLAVFLILKRSSLDYWFSVMGYFTGRNEKVWKMLPEVEGELECISSFQFPRQDFKFR